MRIQVVRAAYFSCGYAYKIPGNSSAQNKKVYGELYKEDGYGQNFRTELSFSGKVDPLSGMIVNLSEIDAWLGEVIIQLDHHFLNTDIELFTKQVPTPENIARFIYNEIRARIAVADVKLTKVRLYENENRWLDFSYEAYNNE